MEINHLPSAIGYGFALSTQSAYLKGQPWDSKVSVMRLRDKNAKRKKGERPEVRIEVHCLREDLHIEEVVFTDKKMTVWSRLTKSKRIAVEQFIKDELSKAGLECGDISDAFARIKLLMTCRRKCCDQCRNFAGYR